MCVALNIRHTYVLSSAPAILSAGFVPGIFLAAVFLSNAPQLRAQSGDAQQSDTQQANPGQSSRDVAETARQERARKQQRSDAKHVYTNEDLRRANILTQEDQQRSAGNRKQPVAPSAQPGAAGVEANSSTPQEPLGDVARRYRRLKTLSPFHLPSDQAILAAPNVVAPKMAAPNELNPGAEFTLSAPVRPEIPASTFTPARPSAPVSRWSVPSAPVLSSPYVNRSRANRIDPFAPRRMQPTPPRVLVRPDAVRPNPLPPNLVQPEAPVLAIRPTERAAILPRAIPPVAPKPPLPVEGSLTRRNAASSSVASVVVQPGDTLWTISRQHLGRGTRWLELLVANPGVADPTRLVPGTSLVLPSKAATGRRNGTQSITVQPGDSLSKIAQVTYGHGSYWPCIAHANPGLGNPNFLAVGQSLVLPESCRSIR